MARWPSGACRLGTIEQVGRVEVIRSPATTGPPPDVALLPQGPPSGRKLPPRLPEAPARVEGLRLCWGHSFPPQWHRSSAGSHQHFELVKLLVCRACAGTLPVGFLSLPSASVSRPMLAVRDSRPVLATNATSSYETTIAT